MPPLIRSASSLTSTAIKNAQEIDLRVPQAIQTLEGNIKEENEDEPEKQACVEETEERKPQTEERRNSVPESPGHRDFKLPVDSDDHNRTMVLQVDRTDLRLISPDRKIILLHKHHRDVTTCVQVRHLFAFVFFFCFYFCRILDDCFCF